MKRTELIFVDNLTAGQAKAWLMANDGKEQFEIDKPTSELLDMVRDNLISNGTTGQSDDVEFYATLQEHCGAVCVCKYHDSENIFEVYISFGEYDEENHTDQHGINDDNIFFYCDNEAELIKLMNKDNGEDFRVLAISGYN